MNRSQRSAGQGIIMLCGVGYRHPLFQWLRSEPECVDCLEITAEHFFDGQNADQLEVISGKYPLFVHGLGLSLGSAEPLDAAILTQFKNVVDRCNPRWISEHVAFTKTAEVDLGHLNPVAPSPVNVSRIAEKARQLADLCGKPVLLENITSFLKIEGELSETDFLNRLCVEGDCRLLLDVTNLFINSRNHRFDALEWLREISPEHIVQLHIVGYEKRGDEWLDSHSRPIQSELWDLLREVTRYAAVEAAIIERDAVFESAREDLIEDLERMREISRDE